MLTLQKLNDMQPHEIFQFKAGHNGERSFMYVAKRGQVNDWAIYTSLNAIPMMDFWAGDKNEIARQGQKLLDEDLIKKLVPCDDEAWARYRK